MWTINETNNLRNSLKMKLCQYSWYVGSNVIPNFEGYGIQIDVSRIDEHVTRNIPYRIKNTIIKVNLKESQDVKETTVPPLSI